MIEIHLQLRFTIQLQRQISFLASPDLAPPHSWLILSCLTNTAALSQAYEELEKLLRERGICLATVEKLPKDSGVAGVAVYSHIVRKLLDKREARGKCVCVCVCVCVSVSVCVCACACVCVCASKEPQYFAVSAAVDDCFPMDWNNTTINIMTAFNISQQLKTQMQF